MKKISEQNGFTLIEAMIALVILVIGITSLYSMQITSIQGNSQANSLNFATNASADCFERLLNVPYGDPTMTEGPHTANELPGMLMPVNVTAINWVVDEWLANDGNDDDGDGAGNGGDVDPDEHLIKQVTITVQYNDNAIAKTLNIDFLKSEVL